MSPQGTRTGVWVHKVLYCMSPQGDRTGEWVLKVLYCMRPQGARSPLLYDDSRCSYWCMRPQGDLLYETSRCSYFVACVYCAAGKDMPTLSRILALGQENAFYPKVFLRSHFSLMIGTRRICLSWRTIPFLYSICAASTDFLKTELFLPRAAVLSRNALHAPDVGTAATFA